MKFNWEKPEIVEIAEGSNDSSNTKKKKEKFLILKHKTKKTEYEVEDNLFLKFAKNESLSLLKNFQKNHYSVQ